MHAALLGGALLSIGASVAEVKQDDSANPEAPLSRRSHDQNILPDTENAGFGALLYDGQGRLALHGGNKTWLYTTGLFEGAAGGQRDWYGKWVSYVREYDRVTRAVGAKRVALGLTGAERWAVIHDVVQVSDELFVAFYSANGTVRAAVSKTPDGAFAAVPKFQIAVTDAWERLGGNAESLESNGAHVLIDDSATTLTLWLGYDSYHVDATAGQLGWAKVVIDKISHSVALIGKHPSNPLQLLPPGYIAARCGGNLSTDLRLRGQHALFYYSRPNTKIINLTIALSDDPLFQHVNKVIEFESPLGDEVVIEKFETYLVGDELHLIYENRLTNGHWGTGVRVYKILQ